jgi:glutamate dehydrogenase (NAD(P)+)
MVDAWDSRLICELQLEPHITGYLVFDSVINGRAVGGLRMLKDVSADELKLLAQAMTLKYGFLGIAMGGAKAGIAFDAEGNPARKREVLRQFAIMLSPLLRSRSYIPGPDMGTNAHDIEWLLRFAGSKAHGRTVSRAYSGFFTALTVVIGAACATQHLGIDLSGATVAIEGFGSVGSAAAQLFAQRGARIVAVSNRDGAIYAPQGLNVKRLVELYQAVGTNTLNLYDQADKISSSQLLELKVDVLSPCARHYTISEQNVNKVQAKIICAGANVPFTTNAERYLFEQGQLCLPDFVTNCGGVLSGAMASMGLSEKFTVRFIESKIGARILSVIRAAEQQGVSPRAIAERIALERFLLIKQQAEQQTVQNTLLRIGGALNSRALLPLTLVKLYAARHFNKVCGDNSPSSWLSS